MFSRLWTLFHQVNSSFAMVKKCGFSRELINLIWRILKYKKGFPGGSVEKNPSANAGDLGWIPGTGRSPGEGTGNTLQHPCLGNPMDRKAWWATVQGVAESWT